MQLHLDRLDLDVKFRGTIACSQIQFCYFEPHVKKAILAVGSATFHDNYNEDFSFVISTPINLQQRGLSITKE